MALQHLRSSTADKRPTPGAMSDGQLVFKDSNGDSVKIGPVHVGTTAPNVTPGAGGQAGNSKGEAWLDTTATNPILKVWNGSAFVAVQPVGTGTVVSTTDTGTVTSTMILDGTILNADVNASAAIAGTKERINIEADGDINIDGGGVYYDATNNRLAIGSTAPVEKLIVADSGSANVYIALQNSTTGTTSTDGWYLGAAGTEFQIYGKENGPITFSLNSSEKARIDTSGSLLVGTSSLLLSSGIICSYFDGSVANGMQIHDTRTTSGTDIAIIFTRNTTNSVGSITTTTTSTAFNTSSDYRLKENVSAVTDGITRLQQLNPSRFNFIADPSRTVDGFIAHEVQTIVPEAITGEKDAVDADGNPVYQSIDQSKLVPLLTAALQEAIGRIETLEAEVAALKAS
jgi:hypothetical protein